MRITLLFLATSLSLHAQEQVSGKAAAKAIDLFRKVFDRPGAGEDMKVAAIQALSKVAHADIVAALLPYVTQDTLSIRVNAVRGLARLARAGGVGEKLIEAFRSPANEGAEWAPVRITILRALGEIHCVAAAEFVNGHIANEQPWIAKAAVDAAAKLRQKSSVEALIKELRSLEGDGGRKKMDADPLAEEMTSASLDFNSVIKYHDQKPGASKDRREILEKAVHDALYRITRCRFRCADEWEKWWQKNKSRFQVPR